MTEKRFTPEIPASFDLSEDEWWYALARISAAIRGIRLEDLEPVDGIWPSDDAKQLLAGFIDRGIAAYEILRADPAPGETKLPRPRH